MSELQYPDDLRYTGDHDWVKEKEDGTIRVGITDYAQDALGDICFVDLPDVDSDVENGEPCGEIESTKTFSDLLSPASGTVTAVNEAVVDQPELVGQAPYSEGWLFEFRLDDGATLDHLMDKAAYVAMLEQD